MKKQTTITDYKHYKYDGEEINHNSFKSMYNQANNLFRNIQFFRQNNKERFNTYDGFMKVFSSINDDINMLEMALKNPGNIRLELIDKKIANGDYQFVFVNLYAKLELLLKNKYKLQGKMFYMLNDAQKSGIIKKVIIDDLQDFRDKRNSIIHPDNRELVYNANDLRRGAKEIFDLEEDK